MIHDWSISELSGDRDDLSEGAFVQVEMMRELLGMEIGDDDKRSIFEIHRDCIREVNRRIDVGEINDTDVEGFANEWVKFKHDEMLDMYSAFIRKNKQGGVAGMSEESRNVVVSLTVEQWEKLEEAAKSQGPGFTLEEFLTGLIANFLFTYGK